SAKTTALSVCNSIVSGLTTWPASIADMTRCTRTLPSPATEASTTCEQMLFCELWSAMPRKVPGGGDVSHPARRAAASSTASSLGAPPSPPRSPPQQLPPKRRGPAPRRESHLVDEAFLEKRVLRVVDAAPHPDWNVRVAHGEIDEIVRHAIGHVFQEALEKIP